MDTLKQQYEQALLNRLEAADSDEAFNATAERIERLILSAPDEEPEVVTDQRREKIYRTNYEAVELAVLALGPGEHTAERILPGAIEMGWQTKAASPVHGLRSALYRTPNVTKVRRDRWVHQDHTGIAAVPAGSVTPIR